MRALSLVVLVASLGLAACDNSTEPTKPIPTRSTRIRRLTRTPDRNRRPVAISRPLLPSANEHHPYCRNLIHRRAFRSHA